MRWASSRSSSSASATTARTSSRSTGGFVRIRFDEAACELKVDRDGDELLLDAVVQLDARSHGAPRRRRAEGAQRVHEAVVRHPAGAVKGASTVENGGAAPHGSPAAPLGGENLAL